MNEEPKASVATKTTLSRQVGAQAARKLKARRNPARRLVRPGHVGAGRLVGDGFRP